MPPIAINDIFESFLILFKSFIEALYFTFLVLLWTVRFFVEFVKEAQVDERSEWILNTGQWLSVPFVAIGVYLMISSSKRPLNDA